jgi:hypothetical protein
MKKLLLTAFLLISVGALQASNLELYFNDSKLDPGATVQVIGDPAAEYIQARVNVKNTSATDMDVFAKKIIYAGDTLPGTINYFCWGLCFTPDTYISPNAVTIATGQTVEEFYGDYIPMNVIGISRITYVFFNRVDVNDSVTFTVEYNASPAGIADLSSRVSFSEAYPNPANSVVKVDYSLPSDVNNPSVVITSMLGSRVKDIPLTERSGKLQIQVSEMVNGIYFYSLVGNGQVILTRKFVVKK